jgi:NADH-quinone oxidoreductase subunit K
MTLGFSHYLAFSGLLFALGLYTVITRRNAVAILMGIELILNAGIVNLVAVARYVTGEIDGQVFALFGILLAAAEAVIALAIVLQLFRILRSVDTSEAMELKR